MGRINDLNTQERHARWGAPEWVGLGLVVAANALLAAWSPLLIPPDGLDYMDGAYTLAHGGGLADFVPYKLPGMTLVLGVAMTMTRHWAVVLHCIQAGLMVATAGLVWLTATRLMGTGRAARVLAIIAAVFVGTHPVLLTYQCYLLRECGAAFLVALTGWLLVRLMTRDLCLTRGLVAAMALGAVCGLGALYRENFQTLLVLGPVIVAWAGTKRQVGSRMAWRVGLGRGAAVLFASILVMSPWLLWMHTHHGVWSVTTPKTQFNRVINAWQNKLIDGTELPGLERGSSDYDYVAKALLLSGVAVPREGVNSVDVVIDSMTNHAQETDALCARLMSTAMAKSPGHAARDMSVAAVSLIGLWDMSWNPAAPANAWHARPLRGMAGTAATNYTFDLDSLLSHSRFTPKRARFDEMVSDSRVNLAWTAESQVVRVFRFWYLALHILTPALASVFLIGCLSALSRRSVGAGALGLLVLVNLLGAAILMMTPTDRFAAPMLPLIVVVAAFAIDDLLARVRRGAAWTEKV